MGLYDFPSVSEIKQLGLLQNPKIQFKVNTHCFCVPAFFILLKYHGKLLYQVCKDADESW